MTNRVGILAAAAAFSPAWLAAQQPGWIATPGSNPVTMRMNHPQGQTGPVTGKPFSATEVRHTVQTLADGSHIDQSESSTFTRDEQGRMRTGNDKTVVIFDPVAGFTYTLDLPSKTYYKAALSGHETNYSIAVAGNRTSISSSSSSGNARLHVAAARPAGQLEEELAVQLINGIPAKGTRVTVTIPARTFGNDRDLKVVNESWYSDDMRTLLKSSNSDPRFGSTTYELTNLVQAAPDPSLFEVPIDYRLRTEQGQH
jgi:hypothetical protein